MKNVIFISPNFPTNYWQFCRELKRNGMNVLGIGDCPYDQLMPELKASLNEYYKVSSLENYDEVFRAVAFLTYKHGKIDWLESNNEYWLERDAALRTAFNITTGFQVSDMEAVKYKSAMKAYYAKAGIKTARWHLVHDYTGCKDFIAEVGYPVIVKPDNGVGASHTYKHKNDDELNYFFATKDDVLYIMEEFVNGTVHTYDGIIDAQGNPLFETGNVTMDSIMDTVNTNGNSCYYIEKELPEAMRDVGRRTVAAFGVKSRFVHLEFFVLNDDQPALGKKGDILGLEVNMRPSGGFSADMFNFANSCDVYKIWADMVAFNRRTVPDNGAEHFYCCYCGRRDGKNFVMDHNAIMSKYGDKIKMAQRIPKALSGAMADMMYLCNVSTPEEKAEYYASLLAER
ncbi:MAG: ATP-grasp domain-containing protein [Clostridiales bacterium]|nr:ATP-grasp domain-containing protein [Clostridiales bacterium]MDY5514605.1 ATP-grasp domain-containing protein [Candidatus Ventricola sp.]